MNLGAKIFIKGVVREIPTIDAGFNDENLLGQEWRYLGVGKDAPRCFNKTGGSIRSSIP